MTNGALVTMAVGATGLLVLGARLLEDPTTSGLVIGIVALVLGTALAAAAVAAAWRSPRRPYPSEGSDPGPTLSASHSSSGRMARQSARTSVNALRPPSSGPTG